MLFYIVGGYFSGGLETAFHAALFCVLPFFAIWFSESMGNWTGSRLGRPSITNSSPGCMVQAVGWLLLFIPIFVYLIVNYGI
jgi:hypothetical protein